MIFSRSVLATIAALTTSLVSFSAPISVSADNSHVDVASSIAKQKLKKINKLLSAARDSVDGAFIETDEMKKTLRGKRNEDLNKVDDNVNSNKSEDVYYYIKNVEDIEDVEDLGSIRLSTMTVDEIMNNDSHIGKVFFDKKVGLAYDLTKGIVNVGLQGHCINVDARFSSLSDPLVVLWPCDGKNRSQWFRSYDDFTLRGDENPSYCMDAGDFIVPGSRVFMKKCNGAAHQTWTVLLDHNNAIINENSVLPVAPVNGFSEAQLQMQPKGAEMHPLAQWTFFP